MYWIIGLQDDIGSAKTLVYTKDFVTGPQVATNWKHDNGTKIESDDISVDAIVETGTLHNKIIDPTCSPFCYILINITYYIQGRRKV